MDPSKDNKPGLMFVSESPEDVASSCQGVKAIIKMWLEKRDPFCGFPVDRGDYIYKVLVFGTDLSLDTFRFLRECFKSRQCYEQKKSFIYFSVSVCVRERERECWGISILH